MKTFVFTVEDANSRIEEAGDKVSDISGKATLRVMPFLKRQEQAKEMQKVAEKQGDEAYGKESVSLCEEYVESIEMEDANGEEITNLDDLGCYEDGVKVIMLMTGMLLGGIKLGNSKGS